MCTWEHKPVQKVDSHGEFVINLLYSKFSNTSKYVEQHDLLSNKRYETTRTSCKAQLIVINVNVVALYCHLVVIHYIDGRGTLIQHYYYMVSE